MINLQFQISSRDVIKTYRFHLRKQRNYWFNIFLSIILIIYSLLQISIGNTRLITIILLTVAAILFFFLLYAYILHGLTIFKREKKFHNPIELSLGKKIIQYRSEDIHSKISWDIYTRILRHKDYYLLYYGKDLFTIIPKRAFASSQEEKAFLDILEKKNIL